MSTEAKFADSASECAALKTELEKRTAQWADEKARLEVVLAAVKKDVEFNKQERRVAEARVETYEKCLSAFGRGVR